MQIVSGASRVGALRRPGLGPKPPWLNLDVRKTHGDVQVSVGHVGPEKEGLELWAPVVRKLLPFPGIKLQNCLWSK